MNFRTLFWFAALLALETQVSGGIIAEHIGSNDPTTEGWYYVNQPSAPGGTDNILTGPVIDDLGSGKDAWTVNDQNVVYGGATGLLGYNALLNPTPFQSSWYLGWQFSINMRIVNAPDTIDTAVTAYLRTPYNGQVPGAFTYEFEFGSQPDGDPTFQLIAARKTMKFALEGAGPGYHLYQLRAAPQSNANLYVDGVEIAHSLGEQNSGTGNLFFGTVNNNIPDGLHDNTGRGNYNLVRFEVLPEPPTFLLALVAMGSLLSWQLLIRNARAPHPSSP